MPSPQFGLYGGQPFNGFSNAPESYPVPYLGNNAEFQLPALQEEIKGCWGGRCMTIRFGPGPFEDFRERRILFPEPLWNGQGRIQVLRR